MKRWLVAAMLLPGAAAAQVADGIDDYPEQPKAGLFAKNVSGVAIDDPYRWMERPERRDEMRRWVNASSLHVTAGLARPAGYLTPLAELTEASKAGNRDSRFYRAWLLFWSVWRDHLGTKRHRIFLLIPSYSIFPL